MSARDNSTNTELDDLSAEERAVVLRVVRALRATLPEKRESMVRAFVCGMEDMSKWRPERKPVHLQLVKGGAQ